MKYHEKPLQWEPFLRVEEFLDKPVKRGWGSIPLACGRNISTMAWDRFVIVIFDNLYNVCIVIIITVRATNNLNNTMTCTKERAVYCVSHWREIKWKISPIIGRFEFRLTTSFVYLQFWCKFSIRYFQSYVCC